MASACHPTMPGSFSLDSTLPPKLDLKVGVKSHIFRPPSTPSASSSLYRTTAFASSEIDSSVTSRKRTRHDSFQAIFHSPDASDWSPGLPSTIANSRTCSPAPLVNTRYRLAGGLDTPTALTSVIDRSNDYQTSPDMNLRGRGWDRSNDLFMDDHSPRLSSALARESNGRPRIYKSPGLRNGLENAVHRFVGVAGTVWEFCRVKTFPGFFAGGGQGYGMKLPTSVANLNQSVWQAVEEGKVFQKTNRDTTPVPGGFPEEDFIPDYMSQDHTTPSRAAKRLQREKGEGSLGASWIVVDRVGVSREASPTRRKVPSTSASGRKPPSRAGRRPILPASRPSLTSYAGSPSLRPDRPASFASSRSPVTSPKRESPVSVEVQRHAARIRKRELEEGANLKRFNQQLKAMIREGKEALGTKIEVVEELDGLVDEGYAEGDYFDERGKG